MPHVPYNSSPLSISIYTYICIVVIAVASYSFGNTRKEQDPESSILPSWEVLHQNFTSDCAVHIGDRNLLPFPILVPPIKMERIIGVKATKSCWRDTQSVE